jgi:hypothetical protein
VVPLVPDALFVGSMLIVDGDEVDEDDRE